MKPIAITLGDPAGIGPEVAARVLAGGLPAVPLLLVGNRSALEQGAVAAGVNLPGIPTIQSNEVGVAPLAFIEIDPGMTEFRLGEVDAACGRLAVRSVERATGLCLAAEVSAMVTCPINKEAIHAAGYVDDIGHQEILARLTGADCTATMLMTPGLKVVHLSTHKSLIEAARYVTQANVLEKLRLMN